VTRVVIDTSVLIRYLIRPSHAIRELIEDRWLSGDVRMVTAPELVDELAAVLARPLIRHFVTSEEGEVLLAAVRALAEATPALAEIPRICRDPNDDKFVACALAGDASHLVTTDADLLALRESTGVRICTPEDFLADLAAGTAPATDAA
jgi:putative PIN family toxin of toxin-antitoxin system